MVGAGEEAGGSGVGSILCCCAAEMICFAGFFFKVQVFWMVCSLAIYHRLYFVRLSRFFPS